MLAHLHAHPSSPMHPLSHHPIKTSKPILVTQMKPWHDPPKNRWLPTGTSVLYSRHQLNGQWLHWIDLFHLESSGKLTHWTASLTESRIAEH